MATDLHQRDHEILSRIDIEAEVSSFVKFAGPVNAEGWRPCHAIDRDDANPSAAINVASTNGARGRYKDSGGAVQSLSFWELMVTARRFPDWRAARDHYAAQTGVAAPARGKREGGKLLDEIQPVEPELADGLIAEFVSHYPPITPEAVKAARGIVCRWNTWRCVAFPADRGSEIAGLILRRIDGQKFAAAGNLGERKTHLVKGSKDGWVILGDVNTATDVWIVEGVPDALALCSRLPAGHVVVSNVCGADGGRGLPFDIFRGKRVHVVGDADTAGQAGARKRARNAAEHGAEARIVQLPYDMTPAHGKDLRDFLNDGGTFERLAELSAGAEIVSPDDDGGIIRIDPTVSKVAVVMRQITDHLLSENRFYNRAGQPVTILGEQIELIDNPKKLAGVLNPFVEFVVVVGTGDNTREKYEPLPPAYATTWLNHPVELQRLPTIRIFTRNPVFTECDVLTSPGFDAASGIYYAGQEIIPVASTERLKTLLSEFCFRRPADRSNYLGILLTVVMLPRFIGCKPGALFNGNQPELGKTILAQIIAILRDGHPVETCTYIDKDEEFEKRLGSRVRSGITTLIIDNAKGRNRGRPAVIESACLERSITDAILSFRLLGFSADIRCENSHIFCITANTPEVSRDLITRCVPINLFFEGDPSARKFRMADPEGYAQEHRIELLAELLGMVERWKGAGKPLANVNTRFNKRGWGNTIGGILQVNDEPGFLENLDDAAHELDPTRRDVAELVTYMADAGNVRWTAAELAAVAAEKRLLADDLGAGSEKSRTTRMGIILSRFVGVVFDVGQTSVPLREAVLFRGDNGNGHVTTYEVKTSIRERPAEQGAQNVMF